jgi:hypothetical protein
VNDRALVADLEALAAALDTLNETVIDRTGGLAQGDPRLREKIIELYVSVMSYGGAPTASQAAYADALAAELKRASGEFAGMTGDRLLAINGRLQAAGASPVTPPSRQGQDSPRK